MKLFATLGLAVGIVGAPCFAAHLTGRLMDASCYHEKKLATQNEGHKTYDSITRDCAATAKTSEFMFRATDHEHEGLTMKLDSNGNSLAAQALKAGNIKADKDGDIHVRAEGKVLGAGEMLQTEKLESDK